MKFAVYLAKTDTGYCAHSPDIPGVVAADHSFEATLSGYKRALNVYLDLIREEGGELPVPRTIAATVEVDDVA